MQIQLVNKMEQKPYKIKLYKIRLSLVFLNVTGNNLKKLLNAYFVVELEFISKVKIHL